MYRRRSIEEQAFGPTEASPISGLRSNLPAMGFSRALQTPEETTNNYIPLEDPSTLLAQKHFGVVTTLHCWGTHSHHSTMMKKTPFSFVACDNFVRMDVVPFQP